MRTPPIARNKKRQLLHIPAVNPHSFLFFFQRGEKASSWSLRDYSQPGRVEVRYAGDFGWEAEEVRQMARHSLDVPVIPTTNLDFWHEETLRRNRQFSVAAAPAPPDGTDGLSAFQFPLLAEDELLGLPKAEKLGDMKRIRSSPNSEDWVTWNFLHLLEMARPQDWWRAFDEEAACFNSAARLSLSAEDEPGLVFWRKVAAPREYEQLSRRRMQESGLAKSVRRTVSSGPVEGRSEIDVSLESRRFLVFLEAKLGSDVSTHTMYDPARNQIARNIDCLLESAAGREPVFWMLVRDSREERMYVQLIHRYRSEPELLKRDLPHRDEAALRRVAARLSIIRWRDLGKGWIDQAIEDPLGEAVRLELLRRIDKA